MTWTIKVYHRYFRDNKPSPVITGQQYFKYNNILKYRKTSFSWNCLVFRILFTLPMELQICMEWEVYNGVWNQKLVRPVAKVKHRLTARLV